MRAPLLILLCAAASAQTPKPEVDWAVIAKQMEALRAAFDARDIEKTQKESSELWHLTTDQWVKQSPTAADRLASAEASRRPGDTNSLVYLAMQAVQAGEFDKAQAYAREALHKPSPVYDSIHAGNTVLGLVALHYGDIPGARAYLLAAAKPKGSLNLKRLGPNLALAKALLDKGENDAVLEYFQLSKTFVTENPKLDDWIALLKAGRPPDLSQEYLWIF